MFKYNISFAYFSLTISIAPSDDFANTLVSVINLLSILISNNFIDYLSNSYFFTSSIVSKSVLI